ncbi:N-acetyltransferase [Planctomycetales bacterium ZRK34]|nr:N-acetyltransferase [Planctomycetales bacterium ZRK34]
MKIRPARVADVPRIAEIVNNYAEQGLMLHRSHAELYERLRDFVVVADDDDLAMGVTGLRIMWANLAEVYSLAVAPEARGAGVGKKLVSAMADEAERLGIRRLFALTYERKFFERCGFEVVDRHRNLPLKVWSECIRCPKNQACDEIAMVRVLEHVPDVAPMSNGTGGASFYDVPILSEPVRRIEKTAGETN